MEHHEDPKRTIARLITEVRTVAGRVSFDGRAFLVREMVNAVKDAVESGTARGNAPEGAGWELAGLGRVSNAAEEHFYDTLYAKSASSNLDSAETPPSAAE